MKIKFHKLLLAIVFILGTSGWSITQAIEEGSFIIDPYYGYPNFGKKIVSSQINNEDVNVRGIGPWGLRMEFMATDQIGITLDGIHNSAGFKHRNTPDTVNDEEGNIVENETEYEYKAMMNRLRVQLGFNYHFSFSNPMLDTYLGFAIGSNNRFWKASTNEPNNNFKDEVTDFVLVPISLRIRFGGRYYFSEKIGVNAELGLGGPVLSTGLSFKF